jgi:hypothetical protein
MNREMSARLFRIKFETSANMKRAKSHAFAAIDMAIGNVLRTLPFAAGRG